MTGELKVKVPMVYGTKLSYSLDNPASNLTLYQKIIKLLLCLTSSRCDIMFVVYYSMLYQANSREPHMIRVKNIFIHLRRTISLGLRYPTNSRFFVHAYFDADLGGCGLDHKSTTGGC